VGATIFCYLPGKEKNSEDGYHNMYIVPCHLPGKSQSSEGVKCRRRARTLKVGISVVLKVNTAK
jgi:hypothetical protein